MELPDEELVRRVLLGDLGLYEVLIRRYNARLFRVTRSVLRDSDEAEDVMQETYVSAYRALGKFSGRSSFSTWIVTIALHEAWKRARNRKHFPELTIPSERNTGSTMESIKSADLNPEQLALRGQLQTILEHAIDSLPEIYRSVFVMRDVESMSTGETATCLNITEEAVKVRLLRARRMLRKTLQSCAGIGCARAYQFAAPRCDRVVKRVLARLAGQGFVDARTKGLE